MEENSTKGEKAEMSIVYCPDCDKEIDTDYDVEHFDSPQDKVCSNKTSLVNTPEGVNFCKYCKKGWPHLHDVKVWKKDKKEVENDKMR